MNLKKLLRKYGIILFSLTLIVGCSDIAGPDINERLQINSISKWKVDPKSDSKLFMIFNKSFDREGNVTNREDYSENGKIISKSKYIYEANKSIEVISSFTDSGDLNSESKTEYLLDEKKRIVRQVSFDKNGAVLNEFKYDYDVNGNLVKKVQVVGGSTGTGENLLINNTYSKSGELLEIVTTSNSGDLSRDSIGYNYNRKSVTIFRFNANGHLIKSTNYIYNISGNIISEIIYNYSLDVTEKYIYEYTYFTLQKVK